MEKIKKFTSKTGKEIIFRYPTIEDAQKMCDYINTLSNERTFIRFQGEQNTLEEETKFVASLVKKISEKKAMSLLAFHEGTLIGNSGIDMFDRTEKHIGLFGISIAKEFRGEGIGRILMNSVIEEAKKYISDLEIVTLSVYAKNGKACALYESLGFIKYGMLPNGIKREDGYQDHVYMYKTIK